MSPQNIEIHEFSTGIHIQQRNNSWVSLGFTGQYMNATINPIPQVVERAIANQEFALTEGASSEKAAIIGRVVGSGDDAWSVIAVVTRGEDEVGRSAAFYRYFLCQGDNSYLRYILTWWEQNKKPRFNPLDVKDSPHLFTVTGEIPTPHLTKEDESLPFTEQKPIVLPVEQQIDLYTLNSLAIRKFYLSKNSLPVSWAFNVEALVKPERFQIIQPASQKAHDGLTRAIANASQIISAVNFDEAALKAGIRNLMNSSQLKSEAVEEIVKALESQEITPEYWENLFNQEGADIGIKEKIYSPQMIRLMTIRAMVLPETLPQFLTWLNIQPGKKPDENQTVSLELQSQMSVYLNEQIILITILDGIKVLIIELLNEQIAPEILGSFFQLKGSTWNTCYQHFVRMIKDDLSIIAEGLYDVQFNLQIWDILIKNWLSIKNTRCILPYYKPLGELFELTEDYHLSGFFYQISSGCVNKNVISKIKMSLYGLDSLLYPNYLGFRLIRHKSEFERFVIDNFLSIVLNIIVAFFLGFFITLLLLMLFGNG